MRHAILFDCEFLCAEGSLSRFWCGPYDPDPVVVQIGAVKIGLEEDFPLLDRLRLFVIPRDRHGNRFPLDPYFTKLTGIEERHLEQEGLGLEQAFERTKDFAAGATLWSWGKDEFNMVAISCFLAGLTPPIPAHQFGNACALLLRAGMPYEDIKSTRSSELADYFQVTHPPLRAHDALDDALSIGYVIQALLRQGKLRSSDFQDAQAVA